jgi:O-glycosyl hydrolase
VPRKTCVVLSAVVAILVAAAAGAATHGEAVRHLAAAQVTVNLRSRHQVIDGFGSTWRVWSDPHLSNQGAPTTTVPPAAQAAILTNLYQTLGLTRARPFLDPGAQQTPGGPFDFARTDAHAALIRQARQFGLKTVLPAPVYLETWILNSGDPHAYVDWAMAVLRRLRADGAPVPYYSVLNEPAVDGNFPPQWMHDVVIELGQRLRAAGFRTKLVIPDDENPIEAYPRAVAVLEDPKARQYVGAVAFHIYNIGGPSDWAKLRQLASRYGLPLWMTEYSSDGYVDWNSSFDWAVKMHTLLTAGGVNAIDYLWGFFGSWTEPATMLSITFQNGVYQSYAPTSTYWITGQYSRYVRPGSVRVDAAASSPLLASAYTLGKGVAVVVLNPSDTVQSARVTVNGGPLLGSVRAVQSSATEHWQSLPSMRPTDGSVSAALPPESITTFLADRR